jgi:hypothetical protein
MEKVLIITYKYPPNFETAANRPLSWAKYLHEFGYKPIIVTRNWETEQGQDMVKNAYTTNPKFTEVKHEIYNTHEVYYVPYFGNFRTRFFLKFGKTNFGKAFHKPLSLLDKLLEYLDIYTFSEFSCLHDWSIRFIRTNPSVNKLVITSLPYQLLKIGATVNKRYGTNWIADYRDPWNTDEIGLVNYKGNDSIFHKALKLISKSAEQKWVGTASYVTSVSPYLTNSIANFVRVKNRQTIFNGFFESDLMTAPKPSKEIESAFKIVYNGTLYDFQPIEVFLDGLKKVILEYGNSIHIVIQFIGLGFSSHQSTRIKNYMDGFEKNIEIMPRIDRECYIDIQKQANLLLLVCPDRQAKGIATSKIFDYLISPKPVLVCPSDNDIVERILTESGQGIFANSYMEVYDSLKKKIDEFIATGKNIIDYKIDNILIYSRRRQTGLLAKVLDTLPK